MATRPYVLTFALAGLMLCGCATVKPAAPRPDVAVLYLTIEPRNASVSVNDEFMGTGRVLHKKPAMLKPGRYLMTVKAPGYFPEDQELDLPAGTTTRDIKLREIPP